MASKFEFEIYDGPCDECIFPSSSACDISNIPKSISFCFLYSPPLYQTQTAFSIIFLQNNWVPGLAFPFPLFKNYSSSSSSVFFSTFSDQLNLLPLPGDQRKIGSKLKGHGNRFLKWAWENRIQIRAQRIGFISRTMWNQVFCIFSHALADFHF